MILESTEEMSGLSFCLDFSVPLKKSTTNSKHSYTLQREEPKLTLDRSGPCCPLSAGPGDRWRKESTHSGGSGSGFQKLKRASMQEGYLARGTEFS
jgi:hypothetical protein